MLTVRRARPQIVMTDLEFPSNMYLFEGFRRYGADIVYVNLPIPCGPICSDCSTRSTNGRCWFRSRSCSSRARSYRTRRAVIEKAHRVGARVILDVYQAAGTVPMQIEALGADFAVGDR